MPTLVVGMWTVAVGCLQHGHASVDHGTLAQQELRPTKFRTTLIIAKVCRIIPWRNNINAKPQCIRGVCPASVIMKLIVVVQP